MEADAPEWADLLGLVGSPDYRSASGVFVFRRVRSEDDPHPQEGSYRFWYVEPDSWRVEDGDGAWHVQNPERQWIRDPHGRMQRVAAASGRFWGDRHPRHLLGIPEERAERFTSPREFSRLLSGPVEVRVADRRCWEVVLSPPPPKPYPLHVAIDDATGAVLRTNVHDYLVFEEMQQFTPDPPDLSDSLFEWDGAESLEWHARGM
jgi:hypothetical protein